MDRTPDDLVSAIAQIRDFAANYRGKRQSFFDGLYRFLAIRIPEGEQYNANVKRMYLAAIGALTSEIQPPSTETYGDVVKRLNSVLNGSGLEHINITVEVDSETDSAYRSVDRVVGGKPSSDDVNGPLPLRSESLLDSLPRKRKLTKRNQALVDKFREEIPTVERPFQLRGAQRG